MADDNSASDFSESFEYDEWGRQFLHISFERVVTESVFDDLTGRLGEQRFFDNLADYNTGSPAAARVPIGRIADVAKAAYPIRLIPRTGKNKIFIGSYESFPSRFIRQTANSPFPTRLRRQRHHLNQDSTFARLGIPHGKGLVILLPGSTAIRNSPHFKFHREMNNFWRQYRSGPTPRVQDYNRVLQRSLEKAGFSPGQATKIANFAKAQQTAYGIAPSTRFIRPLPHVNTPV